MKKFIISTFLFTILFSTTVIVATDVTANYPTRGYANMTAAKSYSGAIFATSDNCNQSEPDAFIKVRSSTKGFTDMSEWTQGIIMQQATCTGVVANDIDIDLEYSNFTVTHGGGTFGGENH